MNRNIVRWAAVSAGVCLASWLALAATAGNVGLQRSISKGALSLFEQPQVVLVVGFVALGLGYAAGRLVRIKPTTLLVGVLAGDLLAGLVLAPLAVGELEPIHAPLVFAAVSLLGLQPAAAFVGAWLGNRGHLTAAPAA